MSSELLPPLSDPLGTSLRLVEQERPAGPDRPDVSFAVDWQVRPNRPEADVADLGLPPPVRPQAAPAKSLTVEVARALGTVVVTARGTIDEVGGRVLKHVLVDLIENQGNMTVVVDLHGVTDLDIRCSDVFVSAHHWAIIRGGQLSLTGVRLRVAQALEAAGVNRVVKATADRILAVPATSEVA